jgi:hypothetical protein
LPERKDATAELNRRSVPGSFLLALVAIIVFANDRAALERTGGIENAMGARDQSATVTPQKPHVSPKP